MKIEIVQPPVVTIQTKPAGESSLVTIQTNPYDIDLTPYQKNLPTTGDGTKFLADDGTYKEVAGGGSTDLTNYYNKVETDSLLDAKANTADLATVATSGSYTDLSDKPTNVSTFTNDAGYLTQHQDISGKVDKQAGKGLSTEDYTTTDKAKVAMLSTTGTGANYLADDGTYKAVSGGSGLDEAAVKSLIAANIVVNNAYTEQAQYRPSAIGNRGIAIGYNSKSLGSGDTAIGFNSSVAANCEDSIAIGTNATVTKGYSSGGVAIGYNSKASGVGVALGKEAEALSDNSFALGALAKITLGYTNSGAIGYNTKVTGISQIQLGNSSQTVYAYGAVQDRSDMRDKADIADCELGLAFINALRPVKYRWDYREDYYNALPDEEKSEEARQAFFENPVKDGSKTRSRYHHGLIAQEFKATLDNLGIDHAAYQDHSVTGGLDVKSIGYTELIPNLIKAIQELSAKVDALEAKG